MNNNATSTLKTIAIAMTMIVILTYAFYCNVKYSESRQQFYETVAQVNSLKENKLANDSYNLIQVKNNVSTLNGDKLFLTEEDDTVTLNELLRQSPDIFFFRYSKLSCNACVDEQLKILEETEQQRVSRKLKGSHIIVITDAAPKKNLYLLKRINNIKLIPILRLIDPDGILKDIDASESPYYFCLDKRLIVNHLFIPNASDLKRTKSYIEFIEEKLSL